MSESAAATQLELETATATPQWTLFALVVIAYMVLTGWNLHIQTISNPDEPRYAVPARLMIRGETGEKGILVPEYNTNPRLFKPIYFYWLIAATGAVGQALGLELSVAMRTGPVLMGLLGVIAVFLLGQRMKGARYGFLAAMILMTTRYYHDVSRHLVVDISLTAFVLWAWLFAHIALRRIEQARNATWPLFGFYVSLGLVSMTKGPILMLLFNILPLLVYLKWDGKFALLKKFQPLWGVPLLLAVSLWWFLTVQALGYDMWQFFMTENVGRALGKKDHKQYLPFWFYFKKLGEFFLPWIIVLPAVIWWSLKGRTAGVSPATAAGGRDARGTAPLSSNGRFLAAALLVPFLLLGLSLSKRPLYILPLYPYLAMWVAWAWEDGFLARESTPFNPTFATILGGFFALAALIGIYVAVAVLPAHGLLPQEVLTAVLLFAGFAVCAWLAGRHAGRGARYRATQLVLALAACLAIGFESIARPVEERERDSVGFYREVCQKLNGRPFVMLGDSANEAVWFLDRPKEFIDNLRYPDLKAKFFEKPGTVLLIKEKEFLREPPLKEALLIGPRILRGDEPWVLALPNPAKPPAASVFEKRSRKIVETPIDDGDD